jgi:dTDP-glucose 4,6-dehydratase
METCGQIKFCRRFEGWDYAKGASLFITGGTGFFGKSMLDYRLRHPEWPWAKAEWVILSRSPDRFMAECPQLANQPGVSFVAGDVRNFAFPAGHFDAIIHAATSAVTTLPDVEMTSVILDGARHVTDFAKAAECSKILFTSSGAVYGPRIAPAGEGDACNPATAYGKGKLAGERLLADAGLDVRIARCFAFVGPHLNRGIHFAIGNFIQNCIDGMPIVVNGDGTPLRSYLYADDLVEWLFAILERGESGSPYNVGSGHAVSIRELAETVRGVLGADVDVAVSEEPVRNARASVYVPVVERAKTELALEVRTPLEDAIRLSAGLLPLPRSVPGYAGR